MNQVGIRWRVKYAPHVAEALGKPHSSWRYTEALMPPSPKHKHDTVEWEPLYVAEA